METPPAPEVPSLYQWMGGAPALERLFDAFYARVAQDPLLAPVFARMDPAHARHVAAFLGEVLGGPRVYSGTLGGHANMLRRHLGKRLEERQRKRWLELLLECADALEVPADPEFRSALLAYLEWGTRLAVLNSQPGAEVVLDQPMPRWGWGEVKGPYRPPQR